MIARDLLSPDDFEWFLDHPRRQFRLIAGPWIEEDDPPKTVKIVTRRGREFVVPLYVRAFQGTDSHAEDLLIASLDENMARCMGATFDDPTTFGGAA